MHEPNFGGAIAPRQLPIPEPRPVVSRPDIVEVLRDAKKHLWDGDCSKEAERYICHQVSRLVDGFELRDEIVEAIEDRLSPCCSFDGWLLRVHGVFSNDRMEWDGGGEVGARSLQAARQRWLDQLIVEFGG